MYNERKAERFRSFYTEIGFHIINPSRKGPDKKHIYDESYANFNDRCQEEPGKYCRGNSAKIQKDMLESMLGILGVF